MKKTLKTAAGVIPETLAGAGCVAISYGASMVYAPAGWIVGGILAIVAGVVMARGQ